MTQTTAAPEVSVCVSPRGDAAVFVTRPAADKARRLDPVLLAAAFAARGLRLVGLSASEVSVRTLFPGIRSIAVTSGSLLDAALSLVAEPQTAVA